MNAWRAQFCSLHFLTMCKNIIVCIYAWAVCSQCTPIKCKRVSIKKRIWWWWDETRFTSIIIFCVWQWLCRYVLHSNLLGKSRKAHSTWHRVFASSCALRSKIVEEQKRDAIVHDSIATIWQWHMSTLKWSTIVDIICEQQQQLKERRNNNKEVEVGKKNTLDNTFTHSHTHTQSRISNSKFISWLSAQRPLYVDDTKHGCVGRKRKRHEPVEVPIYGVKIDRMRSSRRAIQTRGARPMENKWIKPFWFHQHKVY